jgi:hypothetical protein
MDPLPEQERFEVSTLAKCLSSMTRDLSCLLTSLLILCWISLFQINYRDFLQSPLQVITASLTLELLWSPEIMLPCKLCDNGSRFPPLECNRHFLITFLFFVWQPLMDNLEAQTYETFEKDTVKYTQVSVYLLMLYILKKQCCFHSVWTVFVNILWEQS